ncbi:RtcB family protein [Massilia sp. H-1]|nr:RtcB family protein [Massilia sp. H-1]
MLRSHVDAFSHAGLAEGTPEAAAYLAQHDAAVRFARLNRFLIAARIFQRLRCDGKPVLDVDHNTVLLRPTWMASRDGCIAREQRRATRAW